MTMEARKGRGKVKLGGKRQGLFGVLTDGKVFGNAPGCW